MFTAAGRVRYRALKDLLLRLSRARFVINGAIIWFQATLHSVVAVKAAGGCPRGVELGGHVLTVMALATNGDDAR